MQDAKDSISKISEGYVPQGLNAAKDFGDNPDSQSDLAVMRPPLDEDLEHMRQIIVRIRKQLYFILHSVRCWQERHEALDDPIRLRYSAYEGTFCYADLRRHWRYYRHAMAEYAAMREA